MNVNADYYEAASHSVTLGTNNTGGAWQHSAVDMAGAHAGRASLGWRSPYSNPDMEYVYLGSPQPSLLLPEPPLSPVPSNPHMLQPSAAGNGFGDRQFSFAGNAAMTCIQPEFTPVPGMNFQLPPPVQSASQRFNTTHQMNHKLDTPSQLGLYPLPSDTNSQQFDDLWSTLDSELLDATPPPLEFSSEEDFSMTEAYTNPVPMPTPVTTQLRQRHGSSRANPGPTGGHGNTWPMNAMADEAQSSNRGGARNSATSSVYAHSQGAGVHNQYGGVMAQRPGFGPGVAAAAALPNAQVYGGVVMDPGLHFMDLVMGDTITESVSSTSPRVDQSRSSHTQIPSGYGSQRNPGDGLESNRGYGNVGNGLQSHLGSNGGYRGISHAGDFRDHHTAAQRSSPPESNFREQNRQLQRNPATGGSSGYYEAKPEESSFSPVSLLAPGGSGIRNLGEPRWAEQLLNLCAAAIASKNVSRTQHLMWVLNDLASVVGDANQRFAAYGLRALFCRITGRMEAAATFARPRHHDQVVSFGPRMVHRALVKFHEYVPWHQNCYSVTCQTLLEVCAGKSRLHLIDIGAGKGIEWPIFIDALVSRSGGPPSILRMTMIRDLRREELNMSTAKSVNSEAADFMTRLVKFSSLLGLHVEVEMVQKPLECVTSEDLKIREGETLAVVCQFRLHRLTEEPPAHATATIPPQLSPRDEFISFLFKLSPDVFILSDNDIDHCSHDFLTRFQHCIRFWWLCYESMDIGYANRDPQERQILEYEGSMLMLNSVACEGIARIERNESYPMWQRRVMRAGFVSREISEETKKVSQNLVANHSEFWTVVFGDNGSNNMVSLRWRKQPTTFTSVWKTPASCSKPSCKCSMLHS